MLKLLVVTIPLYSAPNPAQWPTYSLGPSYPLEGYGCSRREHSLAVARTFEHKGAREAWNLMTTLRKGPTGGGKAACTKVKGDFVIASLPVFEAEIDAGVGERQRVSVVLARAPNRTPYWLLMRNAFFMTE